MADTFDPGMTQLMMRQRYGGAITPDNITHVLRDLGETWRRVAMQSEATRELPAIARARALYGCATYVEAAADLFDAELRRLADIEAQQASTPATYETWCNTCQRTTLHEMFGACLRCSGV